MSKMIEETRGEDALLNALADSLDQVIDKIEESPEHAVFTLGVKTISNEEGAGVQTFINASGFYGILADGLYGVISDMIAHGDATLFVMLRDVVRDIEEDFGFDPDEEFDDEEPPSSYH